MKDIALIAIIAWLIWSITPSGSATMRKLLPWRLRFQWDEVFGFRCWVERIKE